MVIDVAHASDETIRQVAAASSDPILYAHGGSRSIADTPRNITDEAAKMIAAKGGVIGLQFDNGFNNRNASSSGSRRTKWNVAPVIHPRLSKFSQTSKR